MSICVMSSCVTSIFVMSICATSSCVMLVCVCVMSICVVSVCVMSICVMPICVQSYPKRNLHTARRQTRMPGRHPHNIFAPPIGTATASAIYTQQGVKSACQEDINTKFSHLLLAQLPRTQFTHSKAPNPHGRNTSTQNFRNSYWHSDPKHNVHTASCQTRMPGKHQRKIFPASIGTASPNTIYTQQAAKQLLLAQPPQTQFTNGKMQRQRRRPKTTPKRTSDPLEVPQVPRLPRKTQRQRRRPKTTPKRTSDRLEVPQVPRLPRKMQRQRRRPKTTPKRTSDRLEAPQVPRLPRKMQRQRRRPKTTPKRTSDRLEVPQVPRGNNIGIVDLKQLSLL